MLYFHGNAECVTGASEMVQGISRECNLNVLAMEYAGYGEYQDNGSATVDKLS